MNLQIFNKLSLGTQLKLALMLVLFVPLIFATSYSIIYYSQKINDEALQKIAADLKVAKLIYQKNEEDLKELARLFSQKRAYRTLIELGLYERLFKDINQSLPQTGQYALAIVSREYKVLVESPVIPNSFNNTINLPILDSAFEGSIESASTSFTTSEIEQMGFDFGSKFQDPKFNYLALVATAPLLASESDKINGAFFVVRLLNRDQTLVTNIQKTLGQEISFYEKQGFLISQNNSPSDYSGEQGLNLPQNIITKVIVQGQDFGEANIVKNGHLAQYSPIFDAAKKTIGVISAKGSAETYLNTQHTALMNLIFIAALGVALALVVGFLISHKIVSNLKKLTNGTQLIAGGDYSHQLLIESEDELGKLAEHFNGMTIALANKDQQVAIAQGRLQILLETQKELAGSHDLFSVMLRATNVILLELGIRSDTTVNLYFMEFIGTGERGFAHFQVNVNPENLIGPLLNLNGVEDIQHEFIRHLSKPVEDLQEIMFSMNNLWVPIVLNGDILGLIKIHTSTIRTLTPEQQNFIGSLRHFLALSLEEIILTLELERKVNDRTKQLNSALIQLETQHRQLQMTQANLIQNETMTGLGTLTAGIAHELNNPINFIKGGSQNLEFELKEYKSLLEGVIETDDQEMKKQFFQPFDNFGRCMEIINEGVGRVNQIVVDLRTFTRLDEAEIKAIDLVEDLRSLLRLFAVQHREYVDFEEQFTKIPHLVCWPALLNQVFMNMLINGCQAIAKRQQTEPNHQGKIILSSRLELDKIVLMIIDNGCGMSRAVQEKMFEPFFTTRSIGDGTGLGLTAAFGIIKKHQGEIVAKSEEGIGTQMSIYLPLNLNPEGIS